MAIIIVMHNVGERLRSVNVKEVSQHFRAINTYVLYAYCMAITQEEHSSHKIK